ncbi:hypothetical protein [uncultured Legionella sp.]|uniref:hypothetical protein n=1 Tax=uncultured Legionella sp. TaxID=210934 RepID=UPI002625048C|nr:hypothetical protein [uncultured Legionella sp.]
MKSVVDKLLYKNVVEFNEQLRTLNEQDTTLTEDLKCTVKILMTLGKEATEDQLSLLTEIKNNLKVHRVLLRDIASLLDYLPYPDLDNFAAQLKKNSLQLQSYLELYDKDPKTGRAPQLNKKDRTAKSAEQILEEQFDTSSLKHVIAGVQNLVDGSNLSPQQQYNLTQQVIYINAVGKEFPLTIKQNNLLDLTATSRESLKKLSGVLIKQANDPVLGRNGRIKAQLNMLAVMREQYFRTTGVFLNTTQLLSILLSLNNLNHNGFVELAADKHQFHTKAILAAMQWALNHDPNELLAKDFKYKGTKDFFAFIGMPAQILEANISEEKPNTGIVKPELAGLSRKADVEQAYRVPAHKKSNQQELVKYSQDYLQRISIALNMVEPGQPVLLIARNETQAKKLNEDLALYLKNQNTAVEMDVFTGVESEKIRHQWFNDSKSKHLKIAITIPELANNKEFNIHHSDGCLAIQTYMDGIVDAKKIITNVSSFGKSSHFVAIHEENGILSVLSRSLASEDDKKHIIESIGADKRNRAQEQIIEQYYLQSVITIQRVALSQFDEWQAFLHLIYPASEWKQLDRELLLARQDFITKMELNWAQLLVATDPGQTYPNPYIRRNASNHLDTVILDQALKAYVVNTDSLWNSVRGLLKEKTTDKITPDSVNALRSKYLEQTNLQEQLALDKVITRESVKNLQRDKKKASRLVKSALDVNGALFKYAEGNVDLYQHSFINHQLRLLALDICKQINRSSLSSQNKETLRNRALNADNLFLLELVLIDYEEIWSQSDTKSDKYLMQPVINELLRIHQFAGIEADEQLLVLKNIYLDNAANDLIEDLDHALSWARNENRGIWYLIERSEVQDAAIDILNAVDDVKYAPNQGMKKTALKNLYSVLIYHQAQLEGKWIFSFGHKNTRTLINQTLQTLNNLTVIGNGRDELSSDFMHECKEEAHSNLAKQRFNTAIKKLEERNNWLKNSNEWKEIIGTLERIQNENPSLYAINEMYHFISRKCDELSQSQSQIINPLIHARGTLRSLWHDVMHQHKELLDESVHFGFKAEQIRNNLAQIPGYEVNNIELLAGTNGVSEHYDLVIKGKGTVPILEHFTSYNSQLQELQEERAAVQSLFDLPKSEHVNVDELIKQQLPLINAGKWQEVNIGLFPQSMQDNITVILTLQSYVTGETPAQMDEFSPEIQNFFFDREVINSLDTEQFFNRVPEDSKGAELILQQIDTIKNQYLRTELKALYNKVHPPIVEEKPSSSWWHPKTLLSYVASGALNLVSGMSSTLRLSEFEEDWRHLFADLKATPQSHLAAFFKPYISARLECLTTELVREHQIEVDNLDILDQKIAFLDEAIERERMRSNGTIIRRFDSIGQLYEFENNLRQYVETAPKVSVKEPVYGAGGDKEHIHSDEDVVLIDEDDIAVRPGF